MTEEYLWDRTGEADPLVADLEDKLSELAFEPVFIVDDAAAATPIPPPAEPRTRSWRPYLMGSAATAVAVAASLMLFWCGYQMGQQQTDPPKQATMPVVVGTPEPPEPIKPSARPEAPPPVRAESPQVEPADADEDKDAEPPPPTVADAREKFEQLKRDKAVLQRELQKAKAKGKSKSKGSSVDAAPSSGSSTAKSKQLQVDCILDPSKCGKLRPKVKGQAPPPTGAADPSLPEKLSTTDIRAGVAPVKGSARACGAKHGAKRGEKVKVKLSISGASGEVTKATAQAPHTGTPLGNCVEAAMAKAQFKRFRKASLGAVYPVTM